MSADEGDDLQQARLDEYPQEPQDLSAVHGQCHRYGDDVFLTINLSMDPQVATFEEGNWMQLILRLGAIVIGLFSVIFLFYTNSFLMKRRKTELGLYHVLGMGKTHIASVLLWETLFTALLSIGAGAIGGMVFSKAAQVLLLRMMGRSIDYVFTLQPSALVYSVILFAAIFRAHLRQERDRDQQAKYHRSALQQGAGGKESRGQISCWRFWDSCFWVRVMCWR